MRCLKLSVVSFLFQGKARAQPVVLLLSDVSGMFKMTFKTVLYSDRKFLCTADISNVK